MPRKGLLCEIQFSVKGDLFGVVGGILFIRNSTFCPTTTNTTLLCQELQKMILVLNFLLYPFEIN